MTAPTTAKENPLAAIKNPCLFPADSRSLRDPSAIYWNGRRLPAGIGKLAQCGGHANDEEHQAGLKQIAL